MAQQNQPIPAGAFSGIDKATPRRQRGAFYTPGRYWLRVDGMTYFEDRTHIHFFKVEGTVVRLVDAKPGSLTVGTVTTDMRKREGNEYFLAEVNGIVGNILGLPAEQITEEMLISLVTEPIPLRNMIVEVNCYNRKLKSEKDWTEKEYVREVPAKEVLGVLDQASLDRFFPKTPDAPKGLLVKIAEVEAAQEAEATQA